MTFTEELLELLENALEQAAEGVDEPAVLAQQTLEHLKRDIRCNVSQAVSEEQVTDPRYHYIDSQLEKDFYAWLWG